VFRLLLLVVLTIVLDIVNILILYTIAIHVPLMSSNIIIRNCEAHFFELKTEKQNTTLLLITLQNALLLVLNFDLLVNMELPLIQLMNK